LLCFDYAVHCRVRYSFPTRRSSDLRSVRSSSRLVLFRPQVGTQPAKEARLALLELGVRQSCAGDHANELRKRVGEYRERHERQDEVFGVEVPVQEAGALRVADSLGALDPRLAALLFGDGLPVAGAQGFPLEQADAVDASRGA